jgi:lipopolysaccharide transport system permease protein
MMPHPLPKILIEPRQAWFRLDLAELWHSRELLYFLIWRDVKLRYQQTLIGMAWVIFQPLMTMLILALVFGYFARIPSDGLPYTIFAFTALIPWTYFAQSLNRSSGSLVNNANLVSKVYFPRLIIPLASVIGPALDFLVSLTVLAVMMVWYGIVPNEGIAALPFFMILTFMTALSLSLFLSILYVKYRDIGHAVPFLIQIWMFASPVVYPVSLVPEQWRVLYSLNPMAGVIEGFRWALLGKMAPDFGVIAVSACVVTFLLVAGIVYFKKMEQTFVDVI